jgi:2-phospho-L-lactate transferase/gluconeogenesis factor (CofD/UPF0052 family)
VPDRVSILPAINTNFTHHISAGLADGSIITGQNAISHPSVPTALRDSAHREMEEHDRIEDANWPGSLPTLRKQYIIFSKDNEEELPARIDRIWYINPYGQEIRPAANPKVVESIGNSQAIVYSIGSLYTSIIPSLVLRGVGDAIASSSIRYKILILNSTIDRETGPSTRPFDATDFVAAIAKACAESRGFSGSVTPNEYKAYVTHVLHLHGPDTPRVDQEELMNLGIETVRLVGRKKEGESFARYDETALVRALIATIGKRDPTVDRSRRNTLNT